MHPCTAARIFASIQVLLAVALLFFSPRSPDFDFYRAVDRWSQTRQTPAPRILLWGGSSVNTSTYSPIIENRTGMRTINWGLHADLGLAEFWLERFESLLESGDMVVLSIEYGALQGGGRSTGVTDALLIDVDPSLAANLSLWEAKGILDEGFSFFRVLLLRTIYGTLNLGTSERIGIDGPGSTNDWGDSVGHWDKEPTFRVRKGAKLIHSGASHVDESIDLLNAFARRWHHMGVTTLFFYPAVPQTLLQNSRDEITIVHTKLQNRLEMDALNTPFEMGYPEEWFFDTEYHMTRVGTLHRSRLLADRLALWLGDHHDSDVTPNTQGRPPASSPEKEDPSPHW